MSDADDDRPSRTGLARGRRREPGRAAVRALLARLAWLDRPLVCWTGTPTPAAGPVVRAIQRRLGGQPPGLYAVHVTPAQAKPDPDARDAVRLARLAHVDVDDPLPVTAGLIARTTRRLTEADRFPRLLPAAVGDVAAWRATRDAAVQRARRQLDNHADPAAGLILGGPPVVTAKHPLGWPLDVLAEAERRVGPDRLTPPGPVGPAGRRRRRRRRRPHPAAGRPRLADHLSRRRARPARAARTTGRRARPPPAGGGHHPGRGRDGRPRVGPGHRPDPPAGRRPGRRPPVDGRDAAAVPGARDHRHPGLLHGRAADVGRAAVELVPRHRPAGATAGRSTRPAGRPAGRPERARVPDRPVLGDRTAAGDAGRGGADRPPAAPGVGPRRPGRAARRHRPRRPAVAVRDAVGHGHGRRVGRRHRRPVAPPPAGGLGRARRGRRGHASAGGADGGPVAVRRGLLPRVAAGQRRVGRGRRRAAGRRRRRPRGGRRGRRARRAGRARAVDPVPRPPRRRPDGRRPAAVPPRAARSRGPHPGRGAGGRVFGRRPADVHRGRGDGHAPAGGRARGAAVLCRVRPADAGLRGRVVDGRHPSGPERVGPVGPLGRHVGRGVRRAGAAGAGRDRPRRRPGRRAGRRRWRSRPCVA